MSLTKFEKSSAAKLGIASSKKWLARGEHSSKGTPPRLRPESSHTERGFTLQTLIVTAVLVLVAVGAALVLVAINRSSSDDFEEAGNIGIESKCETWEIHVATLEAAGHGGPEAYGGVASSNIGCLAPCYWDVTGYKNANGNHFYPTPLNVRNTGKEHWPAPSKLDYYDDNRPPAKNQYRLGVAYVRGSSRDHSTGRGNWGRWERENYEGPGTISFRWHGNGVGAHPGTADSDLGYPRAVKPNWQSAGPDPGNVLAIGITSITDKDELAKYTWEDEYWEVRADPGREVCEIVNVAHDDLLVCSSAKDECEPADP